MNRLIALGLGAGAMYFLDPELGERRRRQMARQWSDWQAHAHNMLGNPVEQPRGVGKTAEYAASDNAAMLLKGAGAALVGLGLLKRAPLACMLGTLGLTGFGGGKLAEALDSEHDERERPAGGSQFARGTHARNASSPSAPPSTPGGAQPADVAHGSSTMHVGGSNIEAGHSDQAEPMVNGL